MDYSIKCDGIAILMSVYNGEKFLCEQINSIINQTYCNWRLYIYDDGSTDDSVKIIAHYCDKDSRIMFVNRLGNHLGPALAFMSLVEIIDSDLYMFCDQDDVWLNDKVRITYERYCSVKKKSIPIVIHTDVSVVDENLTMLAESYWHDINLNPDKINKFNYLCVSCYTNGNTMLFNKEAKRLCFPLDGHIIMHDKYVSSRVLKSGGVVDAIHTPLVLYRQHDNNVCGFRVGSQNAIVSRLKYISSIIRTNIEGYRSLRDYHYGSFVKYLWYKFLLEFRMHCMRNY